MHFVPVVSEIKALVYGNNICSQNMRRRSLSLNDVQRCIAVLMWVNRDSKAWHHQELMSWRSKIFWQKETVMHARLIRWRLRFFVVTVKSGFALTIYRWLDNSQSDMRAACELELSWNLLGGLWSWFWFKCKLSLKFRFWYDNFGFFRFNNIRIFNIRFFPINNISIFNIKFDIRLASRFIFGFGVG